MVPTGFIIKEYLEEYGISQKELCKRLGMSEKHISNLLNGKSRLTEEVAIKFETIMKDIPASYWLNYEAKYRLYLAQLAEDRNILDLDLSSIAKRFKFNEVFSGLDWDIFKQAKEMLKLLGISDFNNFEATYSNLAVDFMEDGGELESIIIWLKLCESEIYIQNEDLNKVVYSKDKLEEALELFRAIALNSSIQSIEDSCKTLCNELGIYLVVCKAITNCKVRGALTTYRNHPAIFLSGRFKTHDHIWFAFMHEIGHLLLHYDSKNTIISYDEDALEDDIKEKEASTFARDFLIPPEDYMKFLRKNDFTEKSIRLFASKQKIRSGIVVGRLQRDEVIEKNKLNYLKDSIDLN
jgi:addiction module HigA family antidote